VPSRAKPLAAEEGEVGINRAGQGTVEEMRPAFAADFDNSFIQN
jgi:hypothetical protein